MQRAFTFQYAVIIIKGIVVFRYNLELQAYLAWCDRPLFFVTGWPIMLLGVRLTWFPYG